MADHPHGGDTLHDGLGICLAFTGDLLCADRRHCRRIHRRGTGNRAFDYGVGGAGGSVGDDGRGDRADAGRRGALGHDLATAGLSVTLAAAQCRGLGGSRILSK